ncbi:MAG: hypothetical protein J7K77_02580 [Dehalococcoidales bacterium]|nr:hypothetical protein [Dehalococcoidales bacterium]
MFEVIYYSRSGNTQKLAAAIAEELGVRAVDVKQKKDLAKGSFVFIGSGCYANKQGKGLEELIKENNFKGRSVALFGTSAKGWGDEIKAMKKLLQPTGAFIRGSFHCKGRWFIINRGHPTVDELANAKGFACRMKNLESE